MATTKEFQERRIQSEFEKQSIYRTCAPNWVGLSRDLRWVTRRLHRLGRSTNFVIKSNAVSSRPYIIYRHGTHSQNAIRSAGRISTTLAYVSPFLSSSFLTTYALSLAPRLDLGRKVQRGKCIPHGVSCHRRSRVLQPVLEKCHRRFGSWHCLLDPSIELRRFSFIPCSRRYQSWYSLYSAQ